MIEVKRGFHFDIKQEYFIHQYIEHVHRKYVVPLAPWIFTMNMIIKNHQINVLFSFWIILLSFCLQSEAIDLILSEFGFGMNSQIERI